ncbi:MAG: hypothetical protein KGV56_05965 [Gammaproteobacteria bacterium]|nr:hypothetical protein [Gammaproteobacteria bacterium]
MIEKKIDILITEVRKLNTKDDDLWDRGDIANYLKLSKSSVDKVIQHKDFPKPIKAPTGENGSRPRWVVGEVKRFLLNYR